jgi:hypothetical protein
MLYIFKFPGCNQVLFFYPRIVQSWNGQRLRCRVQLLSQRFLYEFGNSSEIVYDQLSQVDLSDAAARKTAAKEWRSREFELAKAMQVAMVFTHTSLATTPAYSLFLSGMAEGARTHGPVGGGKFNELPIRVAGMCSMVIYLLIVKPQASYLSILNLVI